MKKVLYVITKSNWGGAQRYVYDLAANLPRDQFEVAVACGGNGLLTEKLREKNMKLCGQACDNPAPQLNTAGLPAERNPAPKDTNQQVSRWSSGAWIKVINIPAFQRNINFFKEITAFFQLLKIFRQEKPDIIHLNSSKAGTLGSFAFFIHKLITKNYKLKTIFTVHGWAFKEDRNFLSKFVLLLASWFSSLFQNKIIVINKADLASAKKFIPSKKLSLIHNGVDTINFMPRDKARAFLTEKTGIEINRDTLLVGTIAELNKNKGLSYLIDALRILNLKLVPTLSRTLDSVGVTYNLKLIIIGAGENRTKLEKQINNLGLRDKVFLPGFLPNASHYLKAFDIFILPSLKEGLPYTIIEAMSAELPVIASKVGGIPDLLNHGANGLLVAPKNTAELAENLEKLIQNPTLRQQLGSEAKQKIENEFGFQKMLNQTITLYRGYLKIPFRNEQA